MREIKFRAWDKSCGLMMPSAFVPPEEMKANNLNTQGAAGQAADFEIHPVGTAERLRQL